MLKQSTFLAYTCNCHVCGHLYQVHCFDVALCTLRELHKSEGLGQFWKEVVKAPCLPSFFVSDPPAEPWSFFFFGGGGRGYLTVRLYET